MKRDVSHAWVYNSKMGVGRQMAKQSETQKKKHINYKKREKKRDQLW